MFYRFIRFVRRIARRNLHTNYSCLFIALLQMPCANHNELKITSRLFPINFRMFASGCGGERMIRICDGGRRQINRIFLCAVSGIFLFVIVEEVYYACNASELLFKCMRDVVLRLHSPRKRRE